MIIKIGQEPTERASVVPYSLSYRASEMADDCASGHASLCVAIPITNNILNPFDFRDNRLRTLLRLSEPG